MLKLASLLRREEGSSLVAILIVMLVLTIGGLTIAAAVINTIGVVQDGTDSTSSRAAADAGLADASVQLQRENVTCTPGSPAPVPIASLPGAANIYAVEISCASDPSTGRTIITLVSTGKGEAGSTTVTRAKYGPGLVGALTTMGVGAVGMISLTDPASIATGNVLVAKGDFNCAVTAKVTDTVIARDGSASVSQCRVDRHVVASKAVTVNRGAHIGGSVYALGTAPFTGPVIHTLGASASNKLMFTMDNNATIDGDVYVKGNAVLTSGTIKGSLIAEGNVTVAAGVVIDGGIHAGGTIKVSGKAGDTDPLRSPATGAAAPVVPRPWQLDTNALEWVNVDYTPPAVGKETLLKACPGSAAAAILSTLTAPTVVDWRDCPDINFHGPAVVNLQTDVTIYMHAKINLDRVTIKSNSVGVPRLFHLISPAKDGSAATPPKPTKGTCPTAGIAQFELNNVAMSPDVSGIAYSPCQMNAGGAVWNGMIYGQNVDSFNGSKITYKDLTLPNGDRLRQPLGEIIEMRDIG